MRFFSKTNRLNPGSAARVYKTVAGGETETIIVLPQFLSICCAVMASFQPSALHSIERKRLGASIQEELARTAAPRGVTIEDSPIDVFLELITPDLFFGICSSSTNTGMYDLSQIDPG